MTSPFSRYLAGAFCAAGLVLGLDESRVYGGANPDTVEAHLAAAKAAAGTDNTGIYERLCLGNRATPAAPPAGAARPAAGEESGSAPPRSQWYMPPAKVFDNLYFVGTNERSVWAVTTSDGIIVIDAIHDYAVEAEVVDGLRALGQDPTKINTPSSATPTPITTAARSTCRSTSEREW